MRGNHIITVQPDAYDEIAYPTLAYEQTHPDRLASLATLFGMKPRDVERCRVLELGCGEGGNLFPLALEFPDSKFVGVDRAQLPIAKAQQTIMNLGLENIEMRRADLMDLSSDLGQFDYIIAHGVFSWIPAEVQHRLLAICREFLAPQGVAYVSYNVYPGCRLRQIAREMMLLHTKNIKDSSERLNQGRALIKWLAAAQPESEANAYQILLRETQKAYETRAEAAIFHDDLAEINVPVYFYQFVELAAQHGLQFLCEAEGYTADHSKYPPEVIRQLQEFAEEDVVAKEQYSDFLCGRSFRQTLLCHHEVLLDRSINPEHIRRFHISSQARPVSAAPDLTSEAIEEFHGPKESVLATSFPLAKATMAYLGEIYPASAHFDQILDEACLRAEMGKGRGDFDSDEKAKALAEVILKSYGAGIVQMHLHLPKFAIAVSEKPLASPLARFQARQGKLVTNLFHANIKLEDDLGLRLLLLLDGTRDRATLIRELTAIVEEAFAEVSAQEKQDFLQRLPTELEGKLKVLSQLGLLSA